MINLYESKEVREINEQLEKDQEENLKNGIFFDTDTYRYEEDFEYIVDDLAYLLETYVNKARGEVVEWTMLSRRTSHYGAICNNGATGYGKLNGTDLSRALLMVDSDSFDLRDNDGVLEARFYDHDGTNICEIKPITKSKENTFANKVNHGEFDKLIDYIQSLPSLKIKENMRMKK